MNGNSLVQRISYAGQFKSKSLFEIHIFAIDSFFRWNYDQAFNESNFICHFKFHVVR